jgi:hypothetical protein
MTISATRSATSAGCGAAALSRGRKVANFVVVQAAWVAAVLGASYHVPLLGTSCVAAAIGWHLAVSARSAEERDAYRISTPAGEQSAQDEWIGLDTTVGSGHRLTYRLS